MSLWEYMKHFKFKCENCGKWSELKDWGWAILMIDPYITLECSKCSKEFKLSMELEKIKE